MPLKELLMDAAKNPDLVMRMTQNLDIVLDEYELSIEEKNAIKSGDKKQINELLGGGHHGKDVLVIQMPIIIVTNN